MIIVTDRELERRSESFSVGSQPIREPEPSLGLVGYRLDTKRDGFRQRISRNVKRQPSIRTNKRAARGADLPAHIWTYGRANFRSGKHYLVARFAQIQTVAH